MNRYTQLVASMLIPIFTGVCSSQVVTIKNADFQLDGPAIHQKFAKPKNWNVESKSNKNVVAWNAPGSSAIAIRKDARLSQEITIPVMDEKLASAGQWKLVVAADLLGRSGNSSKPSTVTLDLRQGDLSLAEAKFDVTKKAPVSTKPKLYFSASSQKRGGGKTEFAFDNNPDTIWHSNYGNREPKHPHHLAVDFGKSVRVKGLRYVPRNDLGNGTISRFEIQASSDFENWKTVVDGEFSYQNNQKIQDVSFPKTIKCRAIRLVSHTSRLGDHFASCAELIPIVSGGFEKLIQSSEAEPIWDFERVFLPLSVEQSQAIDKLTISLNSSSETWVAIKKVHAFWVPEKATMNMRGKANGHNGPDLLGAGSYGFNGLMIHQYPALPVLRVHPGSPADSAGILATDLIVGINGRFLPDGNVAPGYKWFESSHEALLGRAAVNAFSKSSRGTVILNVLRRDQIVDLELKLDLPNSIASTDFLTNPETLKVINDDLIQYVLKTQNQNGSWKNNPVHTCLGGLALLSTNDQKYAPQIKAAADWAMDRHAQPNTGFYWHPAFSGIFLCEYYLASGDERVIPVITRMLRMMSSAFHTSKWGTQTFGHGPRGLPYGNKSLVAVMVHVLVFEELAKRCGVESGIYEVLQPYIESAWSNPEAGGHGALGYNASYKDLAEFWSRSGLFALALHLKKEREDMQVALAKIMHQRYPWFRNSHAYGEPGGILGFIGLSQVNSAYFEETLSRYAWWFALAWQRGNGLHFTIPHMGAPYMEGPVLINNGYAVVTNIHKKTLFITGSINQNWLDISKLPHPISDAMVLEQPDGKVRLQTRIPGSKIVYTTDGQDPTLNSRTYKSPFEVKPGTVIKAMSVANNQTGRIAVRGIGFDKEIWKIVDATGFVEKARSIERAKFAIDGDKHIGWIPDVGEGASGLPHTIVIDLGKPQHVSLAGVRFMLEGGASKQIRVSGSKTETGQFRLLGLANIEKFQPDNNVPLESKNKVRYVKFEFDSPDNHPAQKLLMVGEIDIR